MPATLAPLRISPDELLRMPDEGRGFELVNGQLRELNVSTESSLSGAEFIRLLGNFAREKFPGWVFGIDMGFRCFKNDPDMIRKADAAFVSLKRMPVETFKDEGYCRAVPDLVVEAVSLHDTAREVEDKVQEWLDGGTTVVWVAHLMRKVIHAYRANGPIQVYRASDTLTADDVLPGFAVPVADLFRKPGTQP